MIGLECWLDLLEYGLDEILDPRVTSHPFKCPICRFPLEFPSCRHFISPAILCDGEELGPKPTMLEIGKCLRSTQPTIAEGHSSYRLSINRFNGYCVNC